MEINGRTVKFWFSVGAKYEVGSLDKGLGNFMKTVKTAVIMSRAHVERQKYKGEKPDRPLDEAEVLSLSEDEFSALCDEIAAAFSAGNKVTVEAEEGKKKDEASS